MDKSLSQITFEFYEAKEENNEFLPGQNMQPPPSANKSTRGRKSLKENESEIENVDVPPDDILFQKQYYSIGEVAHMFKVNNSLIRYWENEFEILQPKKNRKGDRLFKPQDIKNLVMIHDLLRRRKYTLEGAKDFLKNNEKANEKHDLILSLKRLRAFMVELKANL